VRTKKQMIKEYETEKEGTNSIDYNGYLFFEVLIDIRDQLKINNNRLEEIQKAIDRPQIRYPSA
jgi:flavorubredoxin